jgi:hypothetical protein
MLQSENLMDSETLDRVVKALGFANLHELLKSADNEMSEDEFRQYCISAETAYPILQREMTLVMALIVGDVVNKLESVDQAIFWRGNVKNAAVLLDRFKMLISKAKEFKTGVEPAKEPTSVLPSVSEGGDE